MTPAPVRSIRFPLICAAAYAGGVVGYQPLLTLLLPIQVAAIAGERRYVVLAAVAIVGSFAAGGGNILFGWLSDRSCRRGGGRRGWIAAGLGATLLAFATIPFARTVPALTVAIAAFQLALNAVLAPMMALVAEEVPEGQVGLTTGLFAAGPPLAAISALAFVAPAFADERSRLAVVGAIMAACVVPLIATASRRAAAGAATTDAPPPLRARRDLAIAWGSRVLIQVAGNAVFLDLLYLMAGERGAGGEGLARTGSLLMVATLAPLPVAVLLGRRADRRRRRPVLVALSVVAAGGLATMAASPEWAIRAAGFLAFSVGWNAFLTLQVGYIFRLLPDPRHRGRDLGLINLANTVPTLIGQTLTALVATPRHPEGLLAILAAVTLAGGATMLAVRDVAAGLSRPKESR